MIQLTKELKIRLLQSIKKGTFDGKDYPELAQELHKIEIEIIDRADQVRPDNYENHIIKDSEN